jgi:hypothetical protein
MSILTYAQYKALNNITNDDNQAFITLLLDSVSLQIENYCNRTFAKADYIEQIIQDGCYNYFSPKQYPVNYIKFIGYPANALNITNTSTDNLTLSIVNGILYISNDSTTNTYTLSTYTLTTLSAAILGNYATLTITIDSDVNQSAKLLLNKTYCLDVGDIIDVVGVSNCSNTDVSIRNNMIYGISSGIIIYNAGYDPIPADLQLACSNITLDVTNVIIDSLNTNLKSMSVTNYSWTLQDNVDLKNIINSYIDKQSSTLNYYKRISF